jgi:hypothetical protein
MVLRVLLLKMLNNYKISNKQIKKPRIGGAFLFEKNIN